MLIHPLEAALDFRLVAPRIGTHFEVLENGKLGEKFPAFEDMGNATAHNLLGRQARDLMAHEGYCPTQRRHQTGDGLEGRRLPCPIGPEQCDDGPLRDLKGNALERLDIAIISLDALDCEQGRLPVPIRSRLSASPHWYSPPDRP